MGQDVRIRNISGGDWNGIAALEARTYGADDLSEGRDALESRARPSPATCFVLRIDRQTAGYLLALPYPMFQYPDLKRAERTVFRSRNLHLHDLVIAEHLRGRGLAKRLLHHLTVTARSKTHERISLISVAGSETFWSANGYAAHRDVALPGSYGTNAVYMSKAV
ncbi:GNAT family N-acetyltransferase [Streptomyces sp. NBC_00859]|uniref:GNAT family N-acetyltransferase n=1 Tax=Streptomyces sp. NBC_00859 TaxID=2903682 RepID=UPI0038641B03|nr:GNAT family N-acetyltransferase [Streptomyces sp. NBC_00859]